MDQKELAARLETIESEMSLLLQKVIRLRAEIEAEK